MIHSVLDRVIPRKYWKTGRIYWESYAEAFAYWDEIEEWMAGRMISLKKYG